MIASTTSNQHVHARDDTVIRRLELVEWASSDFRLTSSEVSSVLSCRKARIRLQPAGDSVYRLCPEAMVGRVRTGNLDIRISPKYPVPSLLSMLAEVYELGTLAPDVVGYESKPELVDLLVRIFLHQVKQIVRQGLLRTYFLNEEDLVAVRGNVDLRQTLALHLRGYPKVYCRYEDYTLDGPENGTLLAALEAIQVNPTVAAVRRNMAHKIADEFAGVQPVMPGADDYLEVRCNNRLSSHYYPALQLARLIFDSMGITQDFGSVEANGFLLDMNVLFERFVSRRLERELRPYGVSVEGQRQFSFDIADQAIIKPDMIIQSADGRRIVADTKYKVGDKPKREDLYQILSYCAVLKLSHGVLITVGKGQGRRVVVRDGRTTIDMVPVDLDGTPTEIFESIKSLTTSLLIEIRSQPQAG